jgi:hypothetical protein
MNNRNFLKSPDDDSYSEAYPDFNDSEDVHSWDRTNAPTRETCLLDIDTSMHDNKGPLVSVEPDDRFADRILTHEEICFIYSNLMDLESTVGSHNQFYTINRIDNKIDVSLHLISQGVE